MKTNVQKSTSLSSSFNTWLRFAKTVTVIYIFHLLITNFLYS